MTTDSVCQFVCVCVCEILYRVCVKIVGCSLLLPRVGVARKARSSDRSCPYVCLSVCLFLKRVSGNSYIVENASNATLVPRSPEMEPPLAAVGSATVAVLSQSSGVAAIFGHEAGSRGLQQLRSLHVVVQTTVPWLLLL